MSLKADSFKSGDEDGRWITDPGDFSAAGFWADRSKEPKATVGNWEATAYSGDEPPSLRPEPAREDIQLDQTVIGTERESIATT